DELANQSGDHGAPAYRYGDDRAMPGRLPDGDGATRLTHQSTGRSTPRGPTGISDSWDVDVTRAAYPALPDQGLPISPTRSDFDAWTAKLGCTRGTRPQPPSRCTTAASIITATRTTSRAAGCAQRSRLRSRSAR